VETYEVRQKGPVVAAISAALRASGAKILSEPESDPKTAPFLYSVELPTSGERVDLVCYAFTANKYLQGERPTDEHRFQVKYGSDFKRYHDIYFDPSGNAITLFFGVHLDKGLFVAVDPLAHNPTWFSKSIEFKDEHVDEIQDRGWFGWERHRVAQGRRKVPLDDGDESYTTEAMLGFMPEHFVRYIELERNTFGLPSSERLAFIEKSAPTSKQAGLLIVEHALEAAFDLPAKEILDLIATQRRLQMNVRGSVAERHLLRHLQSVKELTEIHQSDRDAPPDFEVTFRRQTYGIECKNLLRKSNKPKVDFQRTRAPKGDSCGRYYAPDSFDVLAACMEPVTGKWEFKFCPVRVLKAHERCPGKISPNIYINEYPESTPDVLQALSSARPRPAATRRSKES